MKNKSKYWDEYYKNSDLEFDINSYPTFTKSLYLNIIWQIKDLNLLDGAKILDIWWWNGKLIKCYLNESVDKYVVDISDEQIKSANETGIKWYVADIEKEALSFDDEYFDFVILTEVLEHIYDYDFVISEARRVLKKWWKLLITTPNLTSLSSRIRIFFWFPLTSQSFDKSHIRFFRFEDLEEILKVHGFVNFIRLTTHAFLPTLTSLIKVPFLWKFNKNFGEHLVLVTYK